MYKKIVEGIFLVAAIVTIVWFGLEMHDCFSGCDGIFYKDDDNDRYGNPRVTAENECSPPQGFVADKRDCDDSNPAVNPEAPEVCDGVDNNCNRLVDEGFPTTTYYIDADHDGFGREGSPRVTCRHPGDGFTTRPGDCNDSNAAIHPGASDTCNGHDNDCDGVIDNGTYLAEVHAFTLRVCRVETRGLLRPTTTTEGCEDILVPKEAFEAQAKGSNLRSTTTVDWGMILPRGLRNQTLKVWDKKETINRFLRSPGEDERKLTPDQFREQKQQGCQVRVFNLNPDKG